MMKNGISLGTLLLPFLLLANTAQAAIVNLYYEGIIDGVRVDRGSLPYSVGDTISGTLRIDTSIPLSYEVAAGQVEYFYNTPTAAYNFITGYTQSGGWDAHSFFDNAIVIDGDISDNFAYDFLSLEDAEQASLAAPNGDYGSYQDIIHLKIEDYSRQSINGTGLAQNFTLDASDPAIMQGWLIYSRFHVWDNNMQASNDSGRAYFHLTYVEATVVPLPGAMLFMASAFGTLLIAGRRRR